MSIRHLLKMTVYYKGNKHGFSLIEVLAAILILVTAVIPILYVFSYCTMVSFISGRQIQVIQYAIELMEYIRANSVLLGLNEGIYDANNLFELGIDENPPEGLMPNITVVWENQQLSLYRVSVNIQWQAQRSRNFKLTTLIFYYQER